MSVFQVLFFMGMKFLIKKLEARSKKNSQRHTLTLVREEARGKRSELYAEDSKIRVRQKP